MLFAQKKDRLNIYTRALELYCAYNSPYHGYIRWPCKVWKIPAQQMNQHSTISSWKIKKTIQLAKATSLGQGSYSMTIQLDGQLHDDVSIEHERHAYTCPITYNFINYVAMNYSDIAFAMWRMANSDTIHACSVH
jgi:SUMO ligase MMS21 Smc5/6 complex component